MKKMYPAPKEGEPVYLLFRNGNIVTTSSCVPRVFFSKDHYRFHKNRYNGLFLPSDRLVKYVPAEDGEGGVENGKTAD